MKSGYNSLVDKCSSVIATQPPKISAQVALGYVQERERERETALRTTRARFLTPTVPKAASKQWQPSRVRQEKR